MLFSDLDADEPWDLNKVVKHLLRDITFLREEMKFDLKFDISHISFINSLNSTLVVDWATISQRSLGSNQNSELKVSAQFEKTGIKSEGHGLLGRDFDSVGSIILEVCGAFHSDIEDLFNTNKASEFNAKLHNILADLDQPSCNILIIRELLEKETLTNGKHSIANTLEKVALFSRDRVLIYGLCDSKQQGFFDDSSEDSKSVSPN